MLTTPAAFITLWIQKFLSHFWKTVCEIWDSWSMGYFLLSALWRCQPLPSQVSNRKHADILTEEASYVLSGFSCCFLDCVFVPTFWQFDCHVPWCRRLWINPAWSSLSFLEVYIHAFHHNLESYFFQTSLPLPLFSFWDAHNVYVDYFDGISQVFSLRSLFIFFLFLRFYNFNCLIFEFTDSFLCSLKYTF